MIATVLSVILAAGTPSNDIEACEEAGSSGPVRYCLAEKAHERALRELENTLAEATAAAEEEREAYAQWSSEGRQSTFEIDEVEALARAQWAWELSMAADCALVATRFRKAVVSTVPVTEELECRVAELRRRRDFLIARYDLQRAAD